MNESRKLVIECSDSPGLLVRTVLVLERRGFVMDNFKIERNREQSRMYLSVNGDLEKFDQIKKQLAKLVDVASVSEML